MRPWPALGSGPKPENPDLRSEIRGFQFEPALFLLLRAQKLPPEIFVCPSNEVNVFQPDGGDVQARSNFTDYRRNLGYSFADPYPDAAAARAGYRLVAKMNPAFAVAADLNPGTGGQSNSKTHEERGQNVLYADGHATWETSPLCGVGGDNIYTNKSGSVTASPVDATDSLLLPTQR